MYFPLYIFCSFIENLFAVKYCTRLKSTKYCNGWWSVWIIVSFPIKFFDLHFWTARHFSSPEESISQISHYNKAYHIPEPNPWPQRHPLEVNKSLIPNLDFNLVQYFTANKFSIKEQKRYNVKYTHYTDIFPLENQHILYSFIVIHCLQYNIHIGANGIQNPNPMTWISQQP